MFWNYSFFLSCDIIHSSRILGLGPLGGIGMLPLVIWASPPCRTVINLAPAADVVAEGHLS